MSVSWDIYVDGSGTHHDDSPACIGAVVAANGMIMAELSRHVGPGTNMVAELEAIRWGMRLFGRVHPRGRDGDAILYSDNTAAIGLAEGYFYPRVNWDLAKAVLNTRRAYTSVEIQHVKGHAGNAGNDLADWLAGIARARVLGTPPKRRRRVDFEWLEIFETPKRK